METKEELKLDVHSYSSLHELVSLKLTDVFIKSLLLALIQ